MQIKIFWQLSKAVISCQLNKWLGHMLCCWYAAMVDEIREMLRKWVYTQIKQVGKQHKVRHTSGKCKEVVWQLLTAVKSCQKYLNRQNSVILRARNSKFCMKEVRIKCNCHNSAILKARNMKFCMEVDMKQVLGIEKKFFDSC